MNIKESMELIFESTASTSPTTIISLSRSVLYLSHIWILRIQYLSKKNPYLIHIWVYPRRREGSGNIRWPPFGKL